MQLAEAHQTVIQAILANHLPPTVTVWAYGSRVHGHNLKPFSDLDLCLKAPHVIAPSLLVELQHALQASALPIRVDVADWAALSPAFQVAIAPSLALFWPS